MVFSELYVEPFPRLIELFFNLCGMALFLVSALFIYTFYCSAPVMLTNYKMVLAKAILAGINALFYTISAYLYFKQSKQLPTAK